MAFATHLTIVWTAEYNTSILFWLIRWDRFVFHFNENIFTIAFLDPIEVYSYAVFMKTLNSFWFQLMVYLGTYCYGLKGRTSPVAALATYVNQVRLDYFSDSQQLS